MGLDLAIVVAYFGVILFAALRGGDSGEETTAEEFFVCSRSLKWPSIALSTIATNVHGYQFLGMMGSAYLYGMAQANLEINAVLAMLMAAFIFVPLYLKHKVLTITQFIETRLGPRVALLYSVANILIFSTMGLGAALFWGAYAANLVFGDLLSFLGSDQFIRTSIIAVGLGVFSAVYTYYGGLAAVVRTDLVQFCILVSGGVAVMFISVSQLGGWSELYTKTPELMHLHLPADHKQLPWVAIFGLFWLNLNYWGANQAILQRSLAAENLRQAQLGLMVGAVFKYLMAAVIVIPGIALAGILQGNPLPDPDQTFPYLVTHYLPVGLLGLVLCALFASLMSTVDSLFNSIATLFSVDIYKKYLRPQATDSEMVAAGRKTIVATLIFGLVVAFFLLNQKLNYPEQAFTHLLNELRYYINNGIAVILCVAIFVIAPSVRLALLAAVLTVPLTLFLKFTFPDLNYFVRSGIVIMGGFAVVLVPSFFSRGEDGHRPRLISAGPLMTRIGLGLLVSLVMCHWVFH